LTLENSIRENIKSLKSPIHLGNAMNLNEASVFLDANENKFARFSFLLLWKGSMRDVQPSSDLCGSWKFIWWDQGSSGRKYFIEMAVHEVIDLGIQDFGEPIKIRKCDHLSAHPMVVMYEVSANINNVKIKSNVQNNSLN